MKKTIGDKIREIRNNSGMKQIEFATAIGIARPYLSQIESDTRRPGRELLMRISEEFNVPMDWLAFNQDKMNDTESRLAQSEDEAKLLFAFRTMPKEEAQMHLKLMLQRIEKK